MLFLGDEAKRPEELVTQEKQNPLSSEKFRF